LRYFAILCVEATLGKRKFFSVALPPIMWWNSYFLKKRIPFRADLSEKVKRIIFFWGFWLFVVGGSRDRLITCWRRHAEGPGRAGRPERLPV
jgi:hypothetical protein